MQVFSQLKLVFWTIRVKGLIMSWPESLALKVGFVPPRPCLPSAAGISSGEPIYGGTDTFCFGGVLEQGRSCPGCLPTARALLELADTIPPVSVGRRV